MDVTTVKGVSSGRAGRILKGMGDFPTFKGFHTGKEVPTGRAPPARQVSTSNRSRNPTSSRTRYPSSPPLRPTSPCTPHSTARS